MEETISIILHLTLIINAYDLRVINNFLSH